MDFRVIRVTQMLMVCSVIVRFNQSYAELSFGI